MFVPVWVIFLASGTLMAVLAIVWAIRSDQFEEQDRARYLPLAGLSAMTGSPPEVPQRVNWTSLSAPWVADPVAGPCRWTSTITIGVSPMIARPMFSL